MEKDILEIINQALPTISVVANSAVILKLTESVGGVLKTLYEPRLKFRNGKVDIELKELEKNTTTLTLYEANRLKNFLKVAGFAYTELKDI